MYTVDCSIKEVDKLNIFKLNSGFNILGVLHSIKNYEKNFYSTNANYTKNSVYPVTDALKNSVAPKNILTKDKIQIDIWDINPFKCKKYIIFCEGISSEKSNPLQQKAYQRFVYSGWGVIAFDYRGKGKSSGVFSQRGAKEDLRTVFKYLIDRGISPSDIGIIGHSMGSAVAMDFCSQQKTAFTILINPFSKAADMAKNIAQKASMPDFIRTVIKCLPSFLIPIQNKFNNEKAIKKIKSPVYIIHTKDDTVIPVELARKLFSIKKGKNIFYTELEGCEHDLNDEKINFCLKFMENYL